MKYRRFGRTGLEVSEIAFGCGRTGGILIDADDATRRKAVRRALDLGVNWFDTAPQYGNGKSEEALGWLLGEVDVITSTLGKALGGAAGGYVAASAEVCDLLAQRSRPQLFSNALPPTVACSARAAVHVLRTRPDLVARLRENTRRLRGALREAGFAPLAGEGAIIPIIVGETARAIELSEKLLERGVFVTGFGYPVVPEGTARIRVQMSAALEPVHLERALEAFVEVGRESGLVS